MSCWKYIHAFSYQPRSQKSSVIRNQFLRAYRYCDTQFLKEELVYIRQSFLSLGYTIKFIENCRISAFKGRDQEIRKEHLLALHELPFAINSKAPSVKQEPLATLPITYHPQTEKLRPRLNEMGIRLAFNTNSTLRQQLKHRSTTCEQPKGCVYVVNCSPCSKVYIGQTGRQVEGRMSEHSRGPYNSNLSEGAINRHNNLRGHAMDLQNPTKVFKSDCSFTRETVESALMFVAPSIKNNTASSSTHSNEMVASMICKSTKFDWKKLSTCIPHLNEKAIPPNRKHLFGNPDTSTQASDVTIDPYAGPHPGTRAEPGASSDLNDLASRPVAHRLRSARTLEG